MTNSFRKGKATYQWTDEAIYDEHIQDKTIQLSFSPVTETDSVKRFNKDLITLDLPLKEVIDSIIGSTDWQTLNAVIALLTPKD